MVSTFMVLQMALGEYKFQTMLPLAKLFMVALIYSCCSFCQVKVNIMSIHKESEPNCIAYGFWGGKEDFLQFPSNFLPTAYDLSRKNGLTLTEVASGGNSMAYPAMDILYGCRGIIVRQTVKKAVINEGWVGAKVSGLEAHSFLMTLSTGIDNLKLMMERNNGLTGQLPLGVLRKETALAA